MKSFVRVHVAPSAAGPARAAYTAAMSNIADLRKSYERAELDEAASEGDPMNQFGLWLQQALDSQLPEPNAMTLATVGDNGRPSTRVVLIKGYDERGIAWYTNYHSRKGRELAGRPFAALQFHALPALRHVVGRSPRRGGAPGLGEVELHGLQIGRQLMGPLKGDGGKLLARLAFERARGDQI